MDLQTIKAVLKVLLQELCNENGKSTYRNEEIIDLSIKLPEELIYNGLDEKILQNGIEDLLKNFDEENFKEGTINNVIYQALKVIYYNTTQSVRFQHLNVILEDFYNNLIKKLIDLKKLKSIISLDEFYNAVWTITPFVKSLLLSETSSKNDRLFKEAEPIIKELYEFILCPKISVEDCYQIIRNKLENIEDFEFTGYDLKIISQNSGLLGEYFKLRIDLNQNGKTVSHYFFLKYLLKTNDYVRQHLAEKSFNKEELFYLEFIPILNGLGYSELLDFFPKCYFSRKNIFIVFDDVSMKNYTEVSNKSSLTYEQLSEAYQQLSKLHCCGILFEDKLSEILGKEIRLNNYFNDMIAECFANPSGPTKLIFDCAIRTGNYFYEKFPDIFYKTHLDNFKLKAQQAYNDFYEVTKALNKKRNFFCHGDLWSNNFLYKIKSNQCLLVDYQLTRYCSPAYDALFLLTVNTDKKTRNEYGDKLLNEYYSNLNSILNKYKIEVAAILTKKEFLEDVNKIKPTVLCISLHYIPFMLLPRHLLENSKVFEEMYTGDRYKFIEEYWNQVDISRYRELIEDLHVLLSEN